jgi:hypothetical protein
MLSVYSLQIKQMVLEHKGSAALIPHPSTERKGKVGPVLNEFKHYVVKAYGGVDV